MPKSEVNDVCLFFVLEKNNEIVENTFELFGSNFWIEILIEMSDPKHDISIFGSKKKCSGWQKKEGSAADVCQTYFLDTFLAPSFRYNRTHFSIHFLTHSCMHFWAPMFLCRILVF